MNTHIARHKRIWSAIPVGAALLAAGLALTGCATDTSESASDTASANKVLQVGATGQSFPNSYKDGDKLTGYDVDVIEAAAKDAGYTVEWTTADFSGLMGQLESGRLDTVANLVSITDERKKIYDFTDTYQYAGASIVTAKSNDALNSLEDLQGKTVAGVLGSNNLKVLDAWSESSGIKVDVRTYETRDGAMNDVLNGRVDGYIQSQGPLLAQIKRDNLELKFLGDTISTEEIGFPFARDEDGQEALKAINASLDKLRAAGTLTELSNTYYGTDLSVPPTAKN